MRKGHHEDEKKKRHKRKSMELGAFTASWTESPDCLSHIYCLETVNTDIKANKRQLPIYANLTWVCLYVSKGLRAGKDLLLGEGPN